MKEIKTLLEAVCEWVNLNGGHLVSGRHLDDNVMYQSTCDFLCGKNGCLLE